MPTPLLATKLHMPPPRPDLVPRTHLVDALEEAMSWPDRLILVSAPAGFGKTTLVADWLRQTNRSAAWMSLDKEDNDPSRFWRYAIAALQTVDASIGRTVQSVLETQQPPPLESLVAALIRDLAKTAPPIALVLDDYHLIEAEPVHASLNYLLDHLPPSLRLVVITRADPPLALSRRRGRAQLTETRAADLRFSVEEAVRFLNDSMGLDLPLQDIITLERRTEGWIVGLQLAALSLRQRMDRHAFVAAFAGDDRYVVDYLLEEVLQRQSPQVYSFLLKTSILERFCGPLCAAVTGEADCPEILAYLEQANLFLVPLDSRRYWYRYHHLFADLLRRRLGQAESPTERLALYRRAGAWYENEGFIAEAVAMAMSALDYDYAVELLERHILTVFFRSETMIVHRWLADLPETVLRARPFLCAIYGHTIAHLGSFKPKALDSFEYWLQEAEQLAAAAAPAPGESDSAQVSTAFMRNFFDFSRAYLAQWRYDEPHKVIELTLQALAGLPPMEERLVDQNYLRLRSALTFNLGYSYLRLGDENAANQAFSQARRFGVACGDLLNAYSAVTWQSQIHCRHGRLVEAASLCREALAGETTPDTTIPYAGAIYPALGEILLEWNDLTGAEPNLARGFTLCQLTADTDLRFWGCQNLVRLRLAQGDFTGADEVINQAARDWQDTVDRMSICRVRLWLAQSENDPRQLDAARQWAAGREFQEADIPESFMLARVRIAQYRQSPAGSFPGLDPTFAFLHRCLEGADTLWVRWSIELLILETLARQAYGDIDRALDSLQRALIQGQPGGFIRMFADEGRPLQALILTLEKRMRGAPEGPGGLRLDYVQKVLSAFGGASVHLARWEGRSSSRPELVEPLFPRELEVLRLVAAGASNAEIARKLFISINTVKKHLTNILGKLGAANRAEASSRARELGLLA